MSLNGLTFSLLHQTPQGTTLPERAFDFVAGTSVANVVDALTAGISGDVLTISFLYKTGFQNNGYGWHGMTLFDKNNMAPSIGGFTLIANTANYDVTYPYRGTAEVHRHVADTIAGAVDIIAAQLRTPPPGQH